MLRAFVYEFVLPPGGFFVLWLMGWALAFKRPRLGRGMQLGAVLCFLLASLPFFSAASLDTLQTNPPLGEAPSEAQAIVILGGDFLPYAPEYAEGKVGPLSLQRLRHGATWQRATGLPILVSCGQIRFDGLTGAAAMAQCLEMDFGVPTEWQEGESRNTADNARRSASILKAANVEHVILVTHAWHMVRAKESFERQGLVVTAAPTAFSPPPKIRLGSFLPSARSLRDFYWATHEWVGLLYYRMKGI